MIRATVRWLLSSFALLFAVTVLLLRMAELPEATPTPPPEPSPPGMHP